jgi:hypothetical protein
LVLFIRLLWILSATILNAELKQRTILAGHTLACRDLWWGSIGLFSCAFDSTIRIMDLQQESTSAISTNGLCDFLARF